MAQGNGAPTAEQYEELSRKLREMGDNERDASSGFFLPGTNPYAGEWDLNLDLEPCPDKVPDVDTPIAVDAKLVLANRLKNGRVSSSRLKLVHVKSFEDLHGLREASGWTRENTLRESAMREWNWTPDPFAFGNPPIPGVGGGSLGSYLPLWPGPVTRQLYWQDYFAMSAKAFEAYNHDPVSWRCVHMKQEFALGKGLQARVTFSSGSQAGQHHSTAQDVWDEFWERNDMDRRLDMIARDLSWCGEQFLRYFPTQGNKLTIRSLDPASIYDLITDPEDIETVFAYHQQFQTAYQLYPPTASKPPGGVQAPTGPTAPGSPTKYIIRQILPQEIDHYRINMSAYERRGRSDLFPALSWIKRLRDYLTSHVIRADMLSRICWDLTVEGNQAAVQATQGTLFSNGQAPPPGSVFGHNKKSTLEALVPQGGTSGSRYDPVLDALVTMVANSIGLPKDWLGFSVANTRATALVATEPAARSLEELQGTMEQILHDCFDRVMAAAKISNAQLEASFPSIATEDRTAKLQDLSFAEANQWISKETAGSIGAKELGITSYDFLEEQGLIADEFENTQDSEEDKDADPNPITGKKPQKPKQGDGIIRTPMIIATNRQAPKLDPTKATGPQQDEPPGLLVPAVAPGTPGAASGAPAPAQGGGGGATSPPPGANGNGAAPKSRAGFPSDENPMTTKGAANIRKDNAVSEATVTLTLGELAQLVREARPRRQPDDPAFREATERFRQQTAQNLAKLVRGSTGTTGDE